MWQTFEIGLVFCLHPTKMGYTRWSILMLYVIWIISNLRSPRNWHSLLTGFGISTTRVLNLLWIKIEWANSVYDLIIWNLYKLRAWFIFVAQILIIHLICSIIEMEWPSLRRLLLISLSMRDQRRWLRDLLPIFWGRINYFILFRQGNKLLLKVRSHGSFDTLWNCCVIDHQSTMLLGLEITRIKLLEPAWCLHWNLLIW